MSIEMNSNRTLIFIVESFIYCIEHIELYTLIIFIIHIIYFCHKQFNRPEVHDRISCSKLEAKSLI